MKTKIKNMIHYSHINKEPFGFDTPKGRIELSHYKNVMIVKCKNKNFFNHIIPVKLINTINVTLKNQVVKLDKGLSGWFFNELVFFPIEEGYVGLEGNYLKDNINIWSRSLC